MRISKIFLCTLIVMNAFGGLYAGLTNQANPKVQRIHLKTVSISQVKDGVLFVQTADGPVTLKKLRCDKRGVYFIRKDLVETNGIKAKGWSRPHDDDEDVFICRYCHKRFYDKWEYWDHLETVHGR